MPHDLYLAARAAMAKAYAPYSRFRSARPSAPRTAASLPGRTSRVASYPEGWCAETTALGHYVMGGGGRIVEVAVVAERMA